VRILTNELTDTLEQVFTYNLNKRAHIAAIYPYLLMHNAPTGTFKIQLIRDSVVLLEDEFTSSDIKVSVSTSSDYVHAFYPIIPLNPIQIEKGIYTLRLTAQDYIRTTNSYLGWCQQFEDIQNQISYAPTDDTKNSLAFRLKLYKEGTE